MSASSPKTSKVLLPTQGGKTRFEATTRFPVSLSCVQYPKLWKTIQSDPQSPSGSLSAVAVAWRKGEFEAGQGIWKGVEVA